MVKRGLLIACMFIMGISMAEAKHVEVERFPNRERSKADTLAQSERLVTVVDPTELREGVTLETPTTRRRRVDREINRRLFIQKGEYMFGVTGSYSEISSDNAEFLLVLNNITANGSITTVKPFGGYFYKDNRAVGCRYAYTNYSATLESMTLDLGSTNDVAFDIPYFTLSSSGSAYSVFHRSYAALDDYGHFGVFAEVELSASYSDTNYAYKNGDELKSTYSENQSYSISFNPGISAFIYNNVCASLSFEFGGLHYTRIKQYDEAGVMIGEREASKMLFAFNIFAINFGVTVHIW